MWLVGGIRFPFRTYGGSAEGGGNFSQDNRAHTGEDANMQYRAIGLAFMVFGLNNAVAEDVKTPVNSSQLKWGPAPSVFPKGAQIAVLSGDPFKDSLYVVRLKMPSGYKIPSHNHP